MSNYSTNLTEKQWQVIKNIVDPQERSRKHFLREILNAIFYVNKSGCQWRIFPSDFAPWQTVYYYFRKWKLKGIWEEIWAVIHSKARKSIGKDESSSLGIVDSRSVKTSHHVDTDRGIDGNKKIKGRKEHIVVDTLGLLLSINVHEANIHDSKGTIPTIEKLAYNSQDFAKSLLMEAIKVIWLSGLKINLDGTLKLFSDRKKVPKNSTSYPNVGLLRERSRGSKIIEG